MKKLLFYLMVMPAISLFTACSEDHDEFDNSGITVFLTSADLTSDGYFDGLMYYKVVSNSPQEVIINKTAKSAVTVDISEYISINRSKYKCTGISKEAFQDCRNLTTVNIPSSITTIGEDVFLGCTALQKVNIKDLDAWCKIPFPNEYSNPLYYAGHLFLNGVEVTSLSIPNSVNKINNYAFIGCEGLTELTIPNGVMKIGREAFSDCKSMTKVTIPSSVTEIGSLAFYNCDGLRKVQIEDTDAWWKISFSDSESNPLYYAGHLYLNDSEVTELTIPNGIMEIGSYVIANCSSLTEVTIPNSVKSINRNAFSGCSNLKEVKIPNSVTSIGNGAFYNCSSLDTVAIGNGVTAIDDRAFQNCSSLKEMVIPNNVKNIGSQVFSYCSNLAKVNIGSGVKVIGYEVFADCSSLTDVTIGSAVEKINDAFGRCSKLEFIHCQAVTPPSLNYDCFEPSIYNTATLYVPKEAIDAYKVDWVWNRFMNIEEE